MNANMEEITLDLDQVADIREALLIGLTSFGSIEEKVNACEAAERSGEPWPQEARPVHPTGCCDTVSRFATALSFLDIAERAARRQTD